MSKQLVYFAAVYYAICWFAGFIAGPAYLCYHLGTLIGGAVDNGMWYYSVPFGFLILLIATMAIATIPGFIRSFKQVITNI